MRNMGGVYLDESLVVKGTGACEPYFLLGAISSS